MGLLKVAFAPIRDALVPSKSPSAVIIIGDKNYNTLFHCVPEDGSTEC